MKWKGNTTNENFWDTVKIILVNELQHEMNILENKNNVMLISKFFTLGTRKEEELNPK